MHRVMIHPATYDTVNDSVDRVFDLFPQDLDGKSVWSVQFPKGSVAVWPDGCRDLIAIIDKKQPLRIICSGLDVSVRNVVCTNETRFLGVRLAPGVTFPWDNADSDKMRIDASIPWHPLLPIMAFRIKPT